MENIINYIVNEINGEIISLNIFLDKKTYPKLNTNMNIGAGWYGSLIETNDNRIGIKIKEHNKVVILSKIVVENKNSGLGTRILNVVIDYINKNNKVLWLEDVVSKKYFKKFGDLELVSIQNGVKVYQLNIKSDISETFIRVLIKRELNKLIS
jgi:hypothetical protein